MPLGRIWEIDAGPGDLRPKRKYEEETDGGRETVGKEKKINGRKKLERKGEMSEGSQNLGKRKERKK